MHFEDLQFPMEAVVSIKQRRWQVEITLDHPSFKEPVVLIASADNALTWGDGIWFGTKKDLEETENEIPW